MASQSSPPPPPESGAKYAVLGVVLLALAGAGYCAMREDTPASDGHPTASTDRPDARALERSTALQDEVLEIPEEPPDAWFEEPDAGRPSRTVRTVVVGSWDCTGEIDRAAISSVIEEHRQQIRSCYERRLKQQQFLQGSLSLQMRIAQGGNVDAVQVGGSLQDREVFSCVRNVAQRMRFPRVSGGQCAVVSVPFNFTPQQ